MHDFANAPSRDINSLREPLIRTSVLRCLDESGGCANDQLAGVYLDAIGYRLSREQRREIIAWLEREGLVTTTERANLVVIELTHRGLEMIEGRIVVEGMERIHPSDR